jgi:hypothetical protein
MSAYHTRFVPLVLLLVPHRILLFSRSDAAAQCRMLRIAHRHIHHRPIHQAHIERLRWIPPSARSRGLHRTERMQQISPCKCCGWEMTDEDQILGLT